MTRTRDMDIRSFSPRRPLFVLWSMGSPELSELRAALRRQGGVLRWNGVLSPLFPAAVMGEEAVTAYVRAVLRGEPVTLPATLLPSEVRRIEDGLVALRAWRDEAAKWQLVVPGEASWSEARAREWRGALNGRLGAFLFGLWRMGRLAARVRARLPYLRRRLAYAIDKGGRVR